MKDKSGKQNPYATNRGGIIHAPHTQTGEPKATRTEGNDLRVKK